ncbi:MAG TPA: 5-(carboxyamino)imidazole ribonucleotide synthase [Nitrosopumilaceae archaeon]|nr:5-(carboxyamino)imidazole ribonucleotide synthase [Nitrosopumilaceae archaeon]
MGNSGKVLGIIGGGQLGMMLTEAAKKFPEKISKVIVLDPNKQCSASQVGAKQIIADFKDEKAITELALQSDVLTYEIESGNSDVLKTLESKTMINPSPDTLKKIQDKLVQKTFLSENQLPVADFAEINSLEQLNQQVKIFGFPSLLKTRRDAYDGRGNFKINSFDDINIGYKQFNGQKLMLEKFIDFKLEVSVIAARNTKGDIATYPLVENIHEDNILRITIAPARVSHDISKKAENVAKKTMEVLKGAGVFGIEMFVTKNDQILINEIAPRVHNSGHHTLQSSKTSQFEQHLRAILGLSLGSTELLHNTIMYNILGPKNFYGKYKPLKIIPEKGVFLKMYGKNESSPKRKLGHINIVDCDNSQNIDSLLNKLENIKKSIIFELA